MRNAKLDEAQAGIKIAGRNINHLRHADDTTLMAKNKEELKSQLMKVKEESEKAMYKLGFKEAEEPEIKFPTFIASWRKHRNSRKTSTSASLRLC